MMNMSMVCSAIASGLEIIGILLFCHLVMETKKPGILEVGIGILGGIGLTILVTVTEGPLLIRCFLEVLVAVGAATGFSKEIFKKNLGVAIICKIVAELSKFLLGVGAGMLTLDGTFIEENHLHHHILSILIGIAMILVAVVLLQRKKAEKKIPRRIGMYFAMLLLFLLITISNQNRIEISHDVIYMWIMFAVSFFIMLVVSYVNEQYVMEKKLADLSASQVALLEKDYTDLNRAYAANAKMFHDFHNHIDMIRKLVTDEKYAETVAYLDELQAPILEMSNEKWTGLEAVDYLINGKIATAKEAQTDMKVQVEFPNHANLKDVDLCAIIGNLLDNAIEATRQVTDVKQRLISLTIRRINQMLIIKVENSYEAQLLQEAGQLKTTKKDGGLHGWGIQSVRAAAEKYDGTVQFSQENGIFRSVATLSFSGIESPIS